MKEYLLTIVCIAVVDLLTYFLSFSINTSFDRYIKIALKICMLSIIIYPVVENTDLDNMMGKIMVEEKYTDETEISENALYMIERECEEKISQLIIDKLGIKPTKVSIQMKKNEAENSVIIKELKIEMPIQSKSNNEHLEQITKEALGREVEIIYGE